MIKRTIGRRRVRVVHHLVVPAAVVHGQSPDPNRIHVLVQSQIRGIIPVQLVATIQSHLAMGAVDGQRHGQEIAVRIVRPERDREVGLRKEVAIIGTMMGGVVKTFSNSFNY